MTRRTLDFWRRILLVLIASTFVLAQHTVLDVFAATVESAAYESMDADGQADIKCLQPFLLSLHGADGHTQVARTGKTIPESLLGFCLPDSVQNAADKPRSPSLICSHASHPVPLWLRLRHLLR